MAKRASPGKPALARASVTAGGQIPLDREFDSEASSRAAASSPASQEEPGSSSRRRRPAASEGWDGRYRTCAGDCTCATPGVTWRQPANTANKSTSHEKTRSPRTPPTRRAHGAPGIGKGRQGSITLRPVPRPPRPPRRSLTRLLRPGRNGGSAEQPWSRAGHTNP